MSNPSQKPEKHGAEAGPEGARPEAEETVPAGTERPTPAPKGAAETAPPVEEAAVLKDQLLRAMAELENFRRRAEKERQDTAKYAIAGFARDCLNVLDNLRRGLDTVSAADRAAHPALETLAAGMELTERELLATFERHGITKVDPAGQPFDHNFHQAMFEVDDPSRPAGTVVQVMAPGYLLNGRLLRPAMVAVAKGGARAEPVQAPIANEEVPASSEPKQTSGESTGADTAGRDSAGGNDGSDGGPARSEAGESPGRDDGPIDSRA